MIYQKFLLKSKLLGLKRSTKKVLMIFLRNRCLKSVNYGF